MGVNDSDGPIRLREFLPYKIVLLADRVARQTSAVVKRHGDLNLSEWRVVAAIADQPGLTANDVVAITPMDKGVVSRAVKSLIDRKYARREASDADGRIAHLYLTHRGAKHYAAIAADIRAVADKISVSLDENQRRAMDQSIDRLLAATK